jgi:hypothetical protein
MNSSALEPETETVTEAIATSPSEQRIVVGIIALVLLLTTLPYALAYYVSPTFVGQIYNIVDFSVYLSWTRQAADGHFSSLNLFTTLHQHGYLFNLLFLALGGIVRITRLPIPIVFLFVRFVGAIVLLRLAYALCSITYPHSTNARLTSFGLIALSAGFGWMYWPKWADNNDGHFPIDIWQPEAFTFLSIYTSFLFVVATIFILTAIYNLVRGEQSGERKYAVYAGLCCFILGNIHSYDVLHLAAAWGLYLAAISIVEKRIDKERWMRAIIVGAMTLPSTVYEYWVFQHEPAFHARALTKTLSSPLFFVAVGYGLVFVLAVFAIALLLVQNHRFRSYFRDRQIMVWVASWAIAGLIIIYLPVAFQRKMAMGEHIPLCLLAGGIAAYLVSFVNVRAQPALLALLVLLTFPTNALFLERDFRHIEVNRSEIASAHPFLTVPQLDVLTWLNKNTVPKDAIIALPPIGQFIPGYCDRAVWVGHWSETPDYGKKLFKLMSMLSTSTPDELRYRFLLSTDADYLVYPADAALTPIKLKHGNLRLSNFSTTAPSYLQKVFRTAPISGGENPNSGSYIVFRILR